MDENISSLKTSQKLGLLTTVFQHRRIRPLLDTFENHLLVEAHGFLWDKLVEVHYMTQSTDFERETVTRHMVSSAAYQRQQGCDLRLDYCKGVECIWSNPNCAGNKVKANMEVMARVISGYLKSCESPRKVQPTGRLANGKGVGVTD